MNIPTRKVTLRSSLTRAFWQIAIVTTLAYVALVFLPTTPDVDPSAQARLDAPTYTDTLIADNDCWTGEAPADVEVPGHVVIHEGGVTAELKGAHYVGLALDQAFGGTDHGFEIIAFCR